MPSALHRCLLAALALSLNSCFSSAMVGLDGGSKSEASRLAVLDYELPGPLLPSLDSRQSVLGVSEQGVLSLPGGEEIALAGVVCDARMLTYMQALFFGNEPDTLVYLASGASKDGVLFAYVWDIALWELGDPDLEFAPATYSVNESGLRSGWCRPVEQESHDYHRRYVALSEL